MLCSFTGEESVLCQGREVGGGMRRGERKEGKRRRRMVRCLRSLEEEGS